MTGTGNVAFTFAGALTGTNVFKSIGTYTGTTTIGGDANEDVVILAGGDNRLPTETTVTITGAITKMILGDSSGSINQTLAGLVGATAGAKVVAGNAATSTLTLGGAPGVLSTFAGVIGGPEANENNIALVKSGAGAQHLTGANTYTGGTTINGGTLGFSKLTAKPGNVTVGANGAVALGVDSSGFDKWTTSDIDSLWADSLAGFALDSNSRIGIDTSTENITYGSDLSTRGLIKLGAYNLALTGNNTYTGGTEIYGGTLIAGANALGGGDILLGGGSLSNTASRTIAGNISMMAAGTIGVAGGSVVTISGALDGTGNLTTAGGGKLILNGASGLSGATVFNAGTTTLGSAMGITNNFTVAGAVGSKSLLEIQPGATLTVYSNRLSSANYGIFLGNASQAVGVIRQLGGDVLNERRAEQGLAIGFVADSYGAYEIFGGTMTAGFISVGQGGTGLLGVYGGTVNLTSYLFAGRSNGCTGLVDVAGGTLDGSAMANQFAVGCWATDSSTALGVMNVRDGGVLKIKSGVQLQIGKGAGATGIVNLMTGGTAEVWQINNDQATANAYLNFNGGVLKAVANAANFITTAIDGVYIYGGGGTIDDNGNVIGIHANLLAPTGQGVSGITFSNGGSGYIAPPSVTISGGSGFGATAVAQIDYATGIITNILITNPGSGYQVSDSLIVALTGGGGTGAVLTGASLAANVGGSLTKLGSGALALSGINTYSGGTTVSAGALDLLNRNAKPGSGTILVAGGAALALGVHTTDFFTYFDATDLDNLWNDNLAGVSMDAAALVGIDTTAGDFTYATSQSTRGLVKFGNNILTLTGNNTYTGGTAIYGGTLIAGANALGGGNLVLGGATLSNTASRTISGNVALSGTTNMIGTDASSAVTMSGAVTGGSALLKTGAGTLTLSGAATHSGLTSIQEGTVNVTGSGSLRTGANITVGTTVNSPGVMNVQGGSVSGLQFTVAQGFRGTTGIVNQTAGTVDITGANGLLLGNSGSLANGGSVGIYNLSGGTLNANTDMGGPGIGIVLGVNIASTGMVNMTGGNLNTRRLEVGRNGGTYTNQAGIFTQSGGVATIGDLYLASNVGQRSVLEITGGTFTASNWVGLANANFSTGIVVFGKGSVVSFGGVPTARGTSAYSEMTLDGATIRPLYATNTFLSGLTKAFITTNGAIFDVASGNDITAAQSFENAAGQAGTLVKQGVGWLTLSGANNTFSGITTVDGGRLQATSQGALGATPLVVVNSGGVSLNPPGIGTSTDITNGFRLVNNAYLQYWQNGADLTLKGKITLDNGGTIRDFNALISTLIIDQGIDGTGNLQLAATAANNGEGIIVLKGQSSYTGDTELYVGNATSVTVRIETDNALPTTTVLRMRTGGVTASLQGLVSTKFVLNGFNQQVAGLAATQAYAGNTNSIVGGSALLSTLTVNTASNFTFGGRLGGDGANENNLALVKQGNGTLTLTYNHSYTGATTIEGGTLAVNGSCTGGGLITVKSGGTLGGGGVVGGVTVESGGFINPGNSAGELTVDTLTLDGGSTLQFELGDSDVDPSDLLYVTTLSKGTGTGWTLDFMNSGYIGAFTLVNYGSTGFIAGDFTTTGLKDGLSVGTLSVGSNVIELTVIPEPASLGTLGILALAAILRRRLRR